MGWLKEGRWNLNPLRFFPSAPSPLSFSPGIKWTITFIHSLQSGIWKVSSCFLSLFQLDKVVPSWYIYDLTSLKSHYLPLFPVAVSEQVYKNVVIHLKTIGWINIQVEDFILTFGLYSVFTLSKVGQSPNTSAACRWQLTPTVFMLIFCQNNY